VERVELDVYRSCSRSEKRQVLEVFWHRDAVATERILLAAIQYGPWAVLCCVVLALEPIPVVALSFGRVDAVAWGGLAVEAVILLALWWAAVRCTSLRRLAPI
jgi:uncharacterized membrane protein YcjF (UPF0283 family)